MKFVMTSMSSKTLCQEEFQCIVPILVVKKSNDCGFYNKVFEKLVILCGNLLINSGKHPLFLESIQSAKILQIT